MSDQIAKILEETDISDVAQSNMTRYAAKVILDRAIPDARDGFKPVQRRMMYTLHTEKLLPDAKFIKVSTIAGLNMAYYHPHGQADGVLVDLSEPWTKRVPLVEIHGSNGSMDGSPAAAGRYISARQTKAAQLFLNGLDRGAVKMVDSYHGDRLEPTVLPAAIPAALVNGSSGIALGMKTDILPHNPLELLRAAESLVKNPGLSSAAIAEIATGPDFPTGGIMIATKEQIIEDIESGSTSFTVRGTVEINVSKDTSTLTITSVPWMTNTSKLVDQIASLAAGASPVQLEEVYRISESHDNMQIMLEFKKGTTEEKIRQFEALLYKKTDLERKYRSHNLLIVNGKPKVIGVLESLQLFIEFRTDTLRNIWKFELGKLRDRLELVEGLYRLTQGFPILDVMKAIEGRGRQAVINELVEKHGFTERQAAYIADMSVYRLKDSKDKFDQINAEYEQINKDISDRETYLSDASAAKEQLLLDLQNSMNTLSEQVRRTKVVSEVEDVKIERVQEIVDSKPCVVVAYKDLQACYMGTKAFENQKDKADFGRIAGTLECRTDDYVVFLTKQGRAITRRVIDLDQGNLSSTHQPFNKSIGTVKADDEIIAVFNSAESATKRIITISKLGYTKVIEPSKLRSNVSTRGYLKRSESYSRVKDGLDEIVYAIEVNKLDGEFDVKQIIFKTTHHKKANAFAEVTFDVGSVFEREDGRGGNGARHVNTRSGERTILDMTLVYELPNEEVENETV